MITTVRRDPRQPYGFNKYRTSATSVIAKVSFVVLALLGMAVAFHAGRQMGWESGRAGLEQQRTSERKSRNSKLPPEVVARLAQAMGDLRKGRAERVLADLRELDEEFPGTPSLDYAIALAAMHDGDFILAGRKARDSANKGQRVADSLALCAVAESQKATSTSSANTFGDPNLRAKELLEEAISADPLNPSPRIELASVFRTLGRTDEALAEMEAARALLQPVDSAMVVETTIALIKAEQAGGAPSATPETSDTRELFVSALLSVRSGDSSQAAALLAESKRRLPADTFHYLANDPAFRKFSYLPDLREVIGTQ